MCYRVRLLRSEDIISTWIVLLISCGFYSEPSASRRSLENCSAPGASAVPSVDLQNNISYINTNKFCICLFTQIKQKNYNQKDDQNKSRKNYPLQASKNIICWTIFLVCLSLIYREWWSLDWGLTRRKWCILQKQKARCSCYSWCHPEYRSPQTLQSRDASETRDLGSVEVK